MSIAWDELGNLVIEQTISTVVSGGTRLQGEVLAVRPASMVLDVHKTSNRKLFPKGQAEIPRASISEVRVIRHTTAGMRVAGGILGAIGGIAAVTGLGFATDSAAVLIPGMILIIPGAAVAGYYAGKLADRRTTRLTIRPESEMSRLVQE